MKGQRVEFLWLELIHFIVYSQVRCVLTHHPKYTGPTACQTTADLQPEKNGSLTSTTNHKILLLFGIPLHHYLLAICTFNNFLEYDVWIKVQLTSNLTKWWSSCSNIGRNSSLCVPNSEWMVSEILLKMYTSSSS